MDSSETTIDSLENPDMLPVQKSMANLMVCVSCASDAWKLFERAVEIFYCFGGVFDLS